LTNGQGLQVGAGFSNFTVRAEAIKDKTSIVRRAILFMGGFLSLGTKFIVLNQYYTRRDCTVIRVFSRDISTSRTLIRH